MLKKSQINLRAKNTHVDMLQTMIIDLIDMCNLSCNTCIRGKRIMPNTDIIMPLDMYKKILEKAKKHGIRYIGLFNWTEPFLCPNLKQYAKLAHEMGFEVSLSSNLSLSNIDGLEETLQHTARLRVSVSGFSQKIQSINHSGSNIEVIKNNLKAIGVMLRNGLKIDIAIKYLTFDYNTHEQDAFEEFANKHGIPFLRRKGAGNPLNIQNDVNNKVENYIDTMLNPAIFIEKTSSTATNYGLLCEKAIDSIILNATGDVYLCCMKPNLSPFKVGNFLADEFEVICYRRAIHSACSFCRRKDYVSLGEQYKMLLVKGCLATYSSSHN